MKNIKKYLIVFGLLLFAGSAFAQNSQIKIIVNDNNTLTSISADDASRMFLKKTTKWVNGQQVIPVDLPSDSNTRQKFTKSIHGKSISAINAYWQKKIFTGKGVPPVEQQNDKDVIDFVRSNPGAIGYVSANTNTAGVKVLKVVH